MDANFALVLDNDETFDYLDARLVVRDYVCAVCHLNLRIVEIGNHWRVLVVCEEHGTVTKCGRVTVNTVAIEMERAKREFREVIHNLSDLWGELITPKRSREQNLHDLGF